MIEILEFASLVAAALLAACRFFLPIPFGSSSFNWLVGDLRGKLPLNKQAGHDDRWIQMVYQARPLSFSRKYIIDMGLPGLPTNGEIISPNVQFLFRGNLDEALDFSRLLGCSGCLYV